jgi:FkbM family methyltransferase
MSEYFFPSQSPEALHMEARLRAEAARLPEQSRLVLYEIISSCLASFMPTTFVLEEGMIIANQSQRKIAFPSPIPLVKLSHIVFGYEDWLNRKYRLPEFVEVEPGDVVVDCGAYVGGFTISAARIAKEVHAFEPDEVNFRCLERNFIDAANVVLNNVGLYFKNMTMKLNISASSVEHSLLMPDDGPPVAVREIKVCCLKDYCVSRGIQRLDFVKIEAEGVELEVFDGLEGISPQKLAIDVSPERNGESPADEFRDRLSARGYIVRQRGHVMFARIGGE